MPEETSQSIATTIYVAGIPLAGKATFLKTVAEVFAADAERTAEQVREGPEAGWPYARLTLAFTFGGNAYRMFAVTGAAPDAAFTEAAAGASRGIFMCDPQSERQAGQRQLWQQLEGLFPPGSWTFVLNKNDLVPIADNTESLRQQLGVVEGAPVIAISAIQNDSRKVIERFVREVVLPTPPTTRFTRNP